jgi:hypothetical protein
MLDNHASDACREMGHDRTHTRRDVLSEGVRRNTLGPERDPAWYPVHSARTCVPSPEPAIAPPSPVVAGSGDGTSSTVMSATMCVVLTYRHSPPSSPTSVPATAPPAAAPPAPVGVPPAPLRRVPWPGLRPRAACSTAQAAARQHWHHSCVMHDTNRGHPHWQRVRNPIDSPVLVQSRVNMCCPDYLATC